MLDVVAMPRAVQGLRLLDRALLTAHLLTGNLRQAEEAALKAIDTWRPDEDADEVLFQNVVDEAARSQAGVGTSNSDRSAAYLPNELQAVLRLGPQLRSCFVLRILAGLPAQACARLLCLNADLVEAYTCDALQTLARAA